MKRTTVIRILLALEWANAPVAIALGFFQSEILPPELAAYASQHLPPPPLFFLLLGLGVYTVGSVGLFALWRPARTIYLVATVLEAVPQTSLTMPSILPGAAALDLHLATMLRGAILALAYLPVREHGPE